MSVKIIVKFAWEVTIASDPFISTGCLFFGHYRIITDSFH